MKKTLSVTLVVVLLAALLAGCSSKASLGAGVAVASGTPTGGDANAPVDPALGRAMNDFGLDLLKTAAADGKAANTVVSPLSVHASLSMAANGAAGTTAEEMLAVLGLPADITTADASYADILASLGTIGEDGGTTLDIANSIWVDEGFELKQEFIDADRTYFGAQLANVDLQAEGKDAINGWVAEQTRDRITDLIDEVPDDAMVYLVNAVYMKGDWKDAFDAKLTADKEFAVAGSDGAAAEKVPVPMMTRDGSFMYYEGPDGTQAVRLPYKDGRLGMWIVLPPLYRERASGLDYWLGSLDSDAWSAMLSSAGERTGVLTMPKFMTRQRADLANALGGMGMRDAFDPGAADFSNMAGKRLVISRVLHEVYVAVDETGTEAAAATGTEMGVTSALIVPSAPFEMTVDRPFLFAIDDVQTGALLFLGTIGDPR